MARVVGEVNSLASARFAVYPTNGRTAERFGESGKKWNCDLLHESWLSTSGGAKYARLLFSIAEGIQDGNRQAGWVEATLTAIEDASYRKILRQSGFLCLYKWRLSD